LAELVNEGFIYKKHGSGSFYSGQTQVDKKHSYLIGVLTPFASSYIYPQVIQGVDDVAQEKHYNIVLGSSRGNADRELACLKHLLEKNIEGLLIEPAGGFQDLHASKTLTLLKTLKIPVVFMNWKVDDPTVSYVSLNDVEGGFKATSYLAEAGHRRIACIYPHDHIPGLQRYQGYRNALDHYGLTFDSRLVPPGAISQWNDAGYIGRLVKELLELEAAARPTAIFFFNDNAALQGYMTLREAGVIVPDDLSIIGFDDSEPAALAHVPLTTVIHPKYQIGKWAAQILFEDIEHQSERVPRQMLINPTIALRDSVKPI